MMDSNKPSLARVKIKFPDQLWISEIFKKFPDVKMEILYFLPYDLEKSIGNSVIEIMYYDINSIINKIKNHESVFGFSIVEQEENRIKINVKTKDPFLLYGVIKCGVLVNFPVTVRDDTSIRDSGLLAPLPIISLAASMNSLKLYL